MRSIFKYPLQRAELQRLDLPVNAEILTVGVQDGSLVLWALIDIDAPTTWRYIRIIGTGHSIPDNHKLKHVGTIILHDLVWHVFERISE